RIVSSCYLIHFYLCRSGPHRDLHSFPTRRSSDLTAGLQMSQPRPLPCLPTSSLKVRMPVADTISNSSARDRVKCSHSALLCSTPDRKSTRLNSSHLGISYAVFCLKKKKKKIYLHI